MTQDTKKSQTHLPSEVAPEVSLFDRFATHTARFTSRAWFFAACVLLVAVRVPGYFVIGSPDTWQLIIKTVTTIVTFLLVALLQNTQMRADEATQGKLNAIAQGRSEPVTHLADIHDRDSLHADAAELRAAVGIEDTESA